ncbi:MAG: helix-turn-helix domain-containing protein [Coprococcus sp.]|nr:helix-turn-helix domain-containing protein [Coprococcus sp.]
MILADKIINLRKRAGWSQEELAGQLGVTRQSVSKWEGAQSVPDMDKVIQMSRIFEVTTDYLLKDEMEEPEYMAGEVPPAAGAQPMRRITMEEAARYLEVRRKAAPKIAAATFLCIISPICLLLLGSFSEYTQFGLSENLAGGLGLCILLLFVTAGVAIFISCGARSKEFEFLETEVFETEYGVTGMVKERKKEFENTYTGLNIKGTVICILAVIPLFIGMGIDNEFLSSIAVCLLIFLVGIGCILLIYGGVIQSSMEKLLQEGEYTRENKEKRHILGPISAIYWLVVVAVYLWLVMGTNGEWASRANRAMWAIAGVVYGVVVVIVKLIERLINK